MSKMTLQVEVEKEVYDLAKLVGDVVVALVQKKSLAEIAAAELVQLEQAVTGIMALPADFRDDPVAAAKAIALPLADSLAAALAKPQAAPAPAAPSA